MNTTDPIADMLTRIRNANSSKHKTVDIPASNMKKAIADILLNEGYISGVELQEDGYNGKLLLTLKYVGKKKPVINSLKRVSRPGLRVYSDVETMPKVMDGLGIAILSTNKGILTDRQAKSQNVVGEVLCYIW